MKLLNGLNNQFVKNVSFLASGTFIAQCVGVLAAPILSRLYDQNDFGYLGGVVTLSLILSSTATLKFEMAIVPAKQDKEKNALIMLSTVSLVGFVLFFCLVGLFDPGVLKALSGIEFGVKGTLLIGTLSLILGVNAILIQLTNREKKYKRLAKKSIFDKLSLTGSQLLLAFFIGTGISLVLGNIIGAVFGLLILLPPFWKELISINHNIRVLKKTAKKFYRYPLYTAPQNLLNSVSQGLPVIMFGSYFGVIEVGAYFFAMRILQLPSALIGNSVRQVFFKEAAEHDENHLLLKKKFKKVTFTLLLVALAPMGVLFFMGDSIFAFAFGPEWTKAGDYASWMFLWVGLMFANPPSSAMYYILNRQKQQLFIEIVSFTLRFFSLYYGGLAGSMLLSVKLFSLTGILVNLIYIGYIFYILEHGNFNRR
ncbi:oligosaccharide flippase family protein [Flagellimonas sp. HMM57]|uniref:oligosaccharide flippase family protein n=1 Tax=unclassified Flagellimonas TaxID=2644544 RepID=UPI0013CF59A4|nr:MULTISPECIES: oligosaccharide flippase family protein [unclassified Flagellimonas]UII77605.1 oligosaccharide flippase family protein [Flagellimonas sp. HMM57]